MFSVVSMSKGGLQREEGSRGIEKGGGAGDGLHAEKEPGGWGVELPSRIDRREHDCKKYIKR